MEWDKSLIHGPTPRYILSTNFPSCWLLYVSNPSLHKYSNIQHMFSPRAWNPAALHSICQTQRGQVCRMKVLNLLHERDGSKVLFSDLLWFQVKQAALSFLHLVHGSIHPEGNAFPFGLAHDEADVPAVKQSSAAASLQVHCDGKSTTMLPSIAASTSHHEVHNLTENFSSLIGIGETLPFDLYSSQDASIVGEFFCFKIEQLDLFCCKHGFRSCAAQLYKTW